MKDEEKGNDWGQGFQMAVREGEESRDFKWLTFSWELRVSVSESWEVSLQSWGFEVVESDSESESKSEGED